MGKTEAEETPIPLSFSSIFLSKETYKRIAADFHPYHKHDLNAFLHLFTTGLGMWGAFQLAVVLKNNAYVVVAYATLMALTTPFWTAVLHTAFVYGCLHIPVAEMVMAGKTISPMNVCLLAITCGYGLQDAAHYVCAEKTYMSSYMGAKPWMLIVHSIWLMPLVIDSILMRWCFLPSVVSRKRAFNTQVANQNAVNDLRKWIQQNVPDVAVTTHVWPHKQEGTSSPTLTLENDPGIYAGFRGVFAKHHFDIKPIQGMNEIYVTAVGAKKKINSDAVFYTPHEDGPYWWLPFASCYRVLVGITHNKMVRTRFNLQHESQDTVVDLYDVLGFDYNRELHWIDHVTGAVNKERRSLMKLHYVVYPKGWHRYGAFVAQLNESYNTWARGNFLKTLEPDNSYSFLMAWWIWLTTWSNAVFELFCGWSNLVYIAGAYATGPLPFLILTSFRHYVVYMTTFAFREPMVAHGSFMRDCKLYKTIALMHLARRILPLMQVQRDFPAILAVAGGFAITITATARLGMVRTYFGSELNFVKPKWIVGFPYGVIPHPMIVGQLIAFSSILAWWWNELPPNDVVLIGAHMSFYTAHMIQEILTNSY